MKDVPLDVPAHETGRLRLFGIDSESAEGTALLDAAAREDEAALTQALGATHLEPGRAHVLAVKDIAALGLRGYLAEGYGVPHEQLDAAAETLDLAPPHLLVVPSGAFGGEAQTLQPAPGVTPLVAFDLSTPMPPRGPEPTYADRSATVDAPRDAPPPTGPGGYARLLIAALAVILLALIVWALA